MLKFHLNRNPPTTEKIEAERQKIGRQLAVFKRKVWIGALCAGLFSVLLSWPGGPVVIAVAGIITGVSVIPAIETRLGNYRARLSRLSDAARPSQCAQLLEDYLADSLCVNYQQKLAALGRKPVKAEIEMMREWVASKEPLPSDADTVLKGGQPC